MTAMKKMGSLYIVATPIGNWDDITLRALNVLRQASVVVCEEIREGSTLLKKLGISAGELIALNEHNEKEQASDLVLRMVNGQDIALISDCGTPVFADPGHYLIEQAVTYGIEVIPVPGASSLMAALSVLDFRLNEFHFAGFLPREKEERGKVLARLRGMEIPIIVMDTPYRMEKLLEEIGRVFGKNRRATLATNVTRENEAIYRGTVAEILPKIRQKKAEFVLVIHKKS